MSGWKKFVIVLAVILILFGAGVWYMLGIDTLGTGSGYKYFYSEEDGQVYPNDFYTEVDSDGYVTMPLFAEGSNLYGDRVELTIRGGISSGAFIWELQNSAGSVLYRFQPVVGQEYDETVVLYNCGKDMYVQVRFKPETERLSGSIYINTRVRQKRWRFYF